ncbi:MAG: hypothetical protein J1F65_03430 [Clostridiales bacterium]|nr:hypothetical protein [Clostridiales bacterium]
MLFAEPIEFLDILPWLVVAVAVGVLAFLLGKCIKMYRTLKRNKLSANNKSDEQQSPLLAIRGEYFVLSRDVEYKVGEEGQLKAGKYLLRGDGYDKFQFLLNGEEQDFHTDETLQLTDGDWIAALSCNVLIKPCRDDTQENTSANNGLVD